MFIMLNSDLYASDDDHDYMKEAEFNKVSNKLNNDGYRIGKTKEDEKQVQLGFDKGFSEGITLGKALGRLYGKLRCCLKELESTGKGTTNSSDLLLTKIEAIFFEEIPENRRPIIDIINDVKSVIAGVGDASLDEELEVCLRLLN